MSKPTTEHLNINTLLITALGILVWAMAQETHSDVRLIREHQIINEARISFLETNTVTLDSRIARLATKDEIADLKNEIYVAFGPFDGMANSSIPIKIGHNPLDTHTGKP